MPNVRLKFAFNLVAEVSMLQVITGLMRHMGQHLASLTALAQARQMAAWLLDPFDHVYGAEMIWHASTPFLCHKRNLAQPMLIHMQHAMHVLQALLQPSTTQGQPPKLCIHQLPMHCHEHPIASSGSLCVSLQPLQGRCSAHNAPCICRDWLQIYFKSLFPF